MTGLRLLLAAAAVVLGQDVSGATQPLPHPLDKLLPRPVRIEVAEPAAVASAERLGDVKVVRDSVPGVPELTADEAYALEITPSGAKVTASGGRGEIWARQTLSQLVRLADGAGVPCCRIVDAPHLKWRGFMLDTVRNYLPMAALKDVIDGMAAYKLNLFHWHLTENYAWRLESKRHPELQSDRAFLLRHKGLYYTQAEFRELADYAWARGVSLMPEFDFPGHSLAFRKAFGLKSMSDPRVAEIAADLFDELCALVPKEQMPFVHMGTDEVWKRDVEGAAPGALSRMARAIADNGRTVVSWVPGEMYDCPGPHVNMLWTSAVSPEKNPGPYFDACGMYIEDMDPFELTPLSAYWQAATRWERPGAKNLGAIFCAWHDGFVGERFENLLRNQQVFPACALMGDLYWHGRAAHCAQYRTRLPLAGDPLLEEAKEIERRVAEHRDRLFATWRHPFHFLRQTDLRWRLSQADGALIAQDVAQATIVPSDFVSKSNGTVVAETWIRSPVDRTVGAWIGFTHMTRDHGFVYTAPTPAKGEWNRFGASAELNGAKIPPPDWRHPSVGKGKPIADWTPAWTLWEADEVPFADQEYFMREPTPIRLRAGWNHVKLTIPNPQASGETRHRWAATFIPLCGTTDHPREVPGLEYSSSAPVAPDRVVEPKATDEVLVNPGMGICHFYYSSRIWAYGAASEPGDTLDWMPGTSVIYMRLPWCYLEPEEGVYRWDILDSKARPWIAAGKKVAFRISSMDPTLCSIPDWAIRAGIRGSEAPYRGNPKNALVFEPVWDDPVLIEKVSNFYRAFAARYDGNPDVAFVDLGSFGLYGEGHAPKLGEIREKDPAEYDRLCRLHLDLLRKALPRTYLVVSEDIAGGGWIETDASAIGTTPNPFTPGGKPRLYDHPILAYARSIGYGLRDDSIMCNAQRPWGSDHFGRLFARESPVVIESGHLSKRLQTKSWRPELLRKCIEEYRASYISTHGFPEIYWKTNKDVWKDFANRLGYRFELRKVEYPDTVKVSERVMVKSTWVNVGVAPQYANASLTWNLLNEKGVVCWSVTDPRFGFRSLPPKLDDGEKPVEVASPCTFGYTAQVPNNGNDAILNWCIQNNQDDPGKTVALLKPGVYTLAVSVGRNDGKPEIALPLEGGRDRVYPIGKIRVVDGADARSPSSSTSCAVLRAKSGVSRR